MRKVFGIGINKTGTKSTAQFVKQLGLRTMHDRPNGKSIRDAINRGKRAVPFMFSNDAFFDLPEDIDHERLLERFPDARYIMTTRDTKQWVDSRIIHVLHNRTVTGKRSWTEIDTQAWRREKEEHESRVRETFKRLGKLDQLLIVDVCSDPDKAAQKIADFLELPRNDIGFPRLNTGERKLQQISEKFKCSKRSSFSGTKKPPNYEESEPTSTPPMSHRLGQNLLLGFRQARKFLTKYWNLTLAFCERVRFQSPILLKREE
ncbi:hypothetical protein Pan97_30120 [Bremerella volcania]|uniref:Sulfotransferase domain protein n=1 Tax=Bremerella volcania TaxID=2527984 RepID=A0A518C9R4_9BACT|nr:sulfotransferase [Bremerella volcania]QDU75968.1 hypothetical protein Pan97_30120 [Bremerella volcania]